MHAYLLVGNNSEELKTKSEDLAKSFGAKIMEYPLEKIEDVRNLNNFLRLTITEPTLIFVPNINEAGTEALNAFLKNLEEPQDNIYFVLTAPTIRKVLPTIVSRCQIIKSTNKQSAASDDVNKSTNDETENFMKKTVAEKIIETDKIKDREIAIEFVTNLIDNLHTLIHTKGVDYKNLSENLEIMTTTLNNLKKNGNVNLQLTNMVISLI